ncbi:MAG: protein translocase subunit SecD, partial [Actinomycetota bacterium]|nr:protein translocase subunit SecD [Actinomycetota bacterium]
PEKLDQAQEIISSRVNGSGVAAAEVGTRGGDQIIVEIPGERRNDIVDEVGRTAQLRFRLVWGGPAPGEAAQQPGTGTSGGGSKKDKGKNDQGKNDQGSNNRVLSPW